MRRLTIAIAATVLSGAVAVGGCGFGPGEEAEGTVDLRVTTEFGTSLVAEETLEDPTPSDSIVRFLDETVEIETSYGGNFVESIEGLEGSTVNGGRRDWFYFVNGYYADIGAGESKLNPGDRIWWDYRDWREAYIVPGVVGSWPAPFADRPGSEGPPVVVECLTEASTCDDAAGRLEEAGAEPEVESVEEPVEHRDSLRVLVGPWDRLRSDAAAAGLESGPSTSGVYARVESCGRDAWALSVLAPDGQPRLASAAAGLVAAVSAGGEELTWVVTGTDDASVADAVALLDAETLRDRYAVGSIDGEAVSIPAAPDAETTSPEEVCG